MTDTPGQTQFTPASATDSAPKPRSGYRLVLMVVVLLLAGVIMLMKVMQASEQRAAVDLLRDKGGHLEYRGGDDSWLQNILGIDFVKPVILADLEHTDVDIGDADMDTVGDLQGLETLRLVGAKVSDEGGQHLARLSRLNTLNLKGTQIGNATLAALVHCPELVKLSLEDTQIDDAGLAHLARLPKLEVLVLNGTAVGDEGLKHFVALGNLKFIECVDTNVTAAGRDALAEKLTGLAELRLEHPPRDEEEVAPTADETAAEEPAAAEVEDVPPADEPAAESTDVTEPADPVSADTESDDTPPPTDGE
jgi:hypothetical protein